MSDYSELLRTHDADATWHWFLRNRWCGVDFRWHKIAPAISSDLEFLQREIADFQSHEATFSMKARSVALIAIMADDLYLRCAACQVLAVVGQRADQRVVRELTISPDDEVQRNARASLFHLKQLSDIDHQQ